VTSPSTYIDVAAYDVNQAQAAKLSIAYDEVGGTGHHELYIPLLMRRRR
jgi:hypothetical protein